MKKLSFLLFLLPLAFGGCDDDDDARVETWTVASEKSVIGIGMYFGHVPAYIVKKSPNSNWTTTSASIEGFSFERGYECVLRVRIDPVPEMYDGPLYHYTMEKLISRTPAESPVDPKSLCPEFKIIVASDLSNDGYWIKDMRYADSSWEPSWEPFPWEIEGFDFKPGFETHLLIRPVAEYDAAEKNYRVKYHLTQLISSEEKASGGLPE